MLNHFLFSKDYIHKIKLEYISHTRLVNLGYKKTKYTCIDYYTLHLSSHGQKYEFNIYFRKNGQEINWGYGIDVVDEFMLHPKLNEVKNCFIEQKFRKVFDFVKIEEKYMPLIDDIVIASNIFYINPYNSSFDHLLFVDEIEESDYKELLKDLPIKNNTTFFDTIISKLD